MIVKLSVYVVTVDLHRDPANHFLQEVITGKTQSPWAKKEDRVRVFFEDDDQVDQVLSFLSRVVENAQTGRRLDDQVAFVMDVLLPEVRFH